MLLPLSLHQLQKKLILLFDMLAQCQFCLIYLLESLKAGFIDMIIYFSAYS